jgi:hypothetical protein
MRSDAVSPGFIPAVFAIRAAAPCQRLRVPRCIHILRPWPLCTIIFIIIITRLVAVTLAMWLQATVTIDRVHEHHKGLVVCKSAFSAHECDQISEVFVSSQRADPDLRSVDGIRRTNRWDAAKGMLLSGKLDWIYARVVACAGLDQSSLAFRSSVDFSLMHEFSTGDFFDWHVDTSPGDGTGRTVNVNVLLSDPAVDFGGGAFKVGAQLTDVNQGDLYIYPASFPHAVETVTSGRRRSLVIGVLDPCAVNEPDAHARLQLRDMRQLQGRRDLYQEPLRAAYWLEATANHEELARGGLTVGIARLQSIHEQHRLAMVQQSNSVVSSAPVSAPSPAC